MKKILSILFFSTPLLACAAGNSSYKSAAILEHISTITSDKGNRTDRQYWRGLLKWDNECESSFQYPEYVSGIKIYTENEKKYIIRVTCTVGAYQGYQQFYHLSLDGDETMVKALVFPLYEESKKKAVIKEMSAEVWGNVLNNSNYKNLTVLNQYSGYGNCGTLTTYKIIDGKVTATKFRTEPDCESSKASRDPERWPEYPIP